MNARRRRSEQVIDEEDGEYRGDDKALGSPALIESIRTPTPWKGDSWSRSE